MGIVRTMGLSAIGLAVAAGGPAMFYRANDYLDGAKTQWSASVAETADTEPTTNAPNGQNNTLPADGFNLATVGLEGVPIRHMSEVFRFDAVTVRWILQRWPRVSTRLAHLELQGYRIPLVTGTAPTDIAGSLTYYFDPNQRLKRITFRGTTADVRGLVQILVAQHRFQRRLTNMPGVFLYERLDESGNRDGLLRINSAQVIKANDPYQRFNVDLVIDRPASSDDDQVALQ